MSKTRITPRPGRAVAEEMQAQAERSFANHVIRSRSEGRWVIQKKHTDGGWENAYWVEIIALRGGSLLVHGDIDHVIFGQFRDSMDPDAVVNWMGKHNSVDSYVLQKASIGMGGSRACLTEKDDSVWLHDAKEFAEENYVQHGVGVPEWLGDAISEMEAPFGAALDEIIREMMESSDAYHAEPFNWGEIPSWQLVAAHTAVRRLTALLDQERKENIQ